jgi:alkylation response protein AidB-like acyl-CoA dehydrogenase
MAEAAKVCGATGFMMWCQCVAGLYLQASGNPGPDRRACWQRHVRGELGMGGTALSNPMKSFAQIESLLLKATPVDGGYLVNGTLPWVSNLAPDHYCGAIAAVVEADGAAASREVMFMLRCDAPGVSSRPAPSSRAWRARAPSACGCKDLSSARPTSWPTRPSPPLPASARLRDAAVRHGGRHHPGRHRLDVGGGRPSWATSTSSWKTGRPICRPSWTRWPAAS